MAFKRIDIKSAVEEERIDKEFDSEYKKIKQEYKNGYLAEIIDASTNKKYWQAGVVNAYSCVKVRSIKRCP